MPTGSSRTLRTTRSRAVAKPKPRWGRIVGVGFLLGCVWLGFEYGTLPEVGELDRKNPTTTALIEQRAEEAREAGRKPKRRQEWVTLAQVPKYVADAVLISEDARFYQHEGVDLDETKRALEQAWDQGHLGRGASTITQQLAKNLWLSNERSLLRKAKELILARRLEDALTKRRILALYLNVAEWGDGIYGIEAAAKTHFGISASELSVAQGAMLAGMLPAPRKWTPESRSPRLRTRARRIIDRMEQFGRISAEVAAGARAEVDAKLGRSKDEEADDE